jgi:hypothetical protein
MNKDIFKLLSAINGLFGTGNFIYLLIMLIAHKDMSIEDFYEQHSTAFFMLSISFILLMEFFVPYHKKHFDK